MPTRVIIDCDPGHDDAMALLLALASPELEVAAVTTVAGNQTIDKVTGNAIRILMWHRHAIFRWLRGRTARSSTRPGGRRRPRRDRARRARAARPVTRAGADPRRRADGADAARAPATLIPVGPLTNVALFLRPHPELTHRIEQVVLMGGAIGLGNVTPGAEFNIWVDPEAAQRVFASGLELTMVGLDVTHRAMLSPRGPRRCAKPATPEPSSPTSTPSTGGSTRGLWA